MVTETEKAIGRYLTNGKNRIKIVLKSSLRNLFGPHHVNGNPEPMGVGPHLFTMRGSWQDGVSPHYTDEYHSVPFGVDQIEIISK